MKKIFTSASIVAVTAALGCFSPVYAQEGRQGFYFGLGVLSGQISAEGFGGTDGFGTSSEEDHTGVSAFAGYRRDEGTIFVAGELGFNNLPGVDGVDSVVRLRALVGMPVGRVDTFLSLGVAVIDGDAAIDGAKSGLSIGIGTQIPLTDRFDLRLELLHDRFNDVGFKGEDWEDTSLRAAAIFRF